MKASASIEMVFTEYAFLERIEKAAEFGFDAVEFGSWQDKDLAAIKATCDRAHVDIALFQSNLGGTLVCPDQRERFIAGVSRSICKAQEIGARTLFLLTDEMDEFFAVRYRFPELSEAARHQSVLDGLRKLAPLAEQAGVTLVVEPLNTVDYPGYFLDRASAGFDLLAEVGSPCIKLLFDIYHVQIMEGNIINRLSRNLDLVGHIHVADVPGRHQPGSGELNFANIFRALASSGYDGYVGFEFLPTGKSETAAAEALGLLKGAEWDESRRP